MCRLCWLTTEAFHELYQKSKLAQETFLNSMIKIEVDPIVLYPESNDRHFDDEQPFDIDDIKAESTLGRTLLNPYKFVTVLNLTE